MYGKGWRCKPDWITSLTRSTGLLTNSSPAASPSATSARTAVSCAAERGTARPARRPPSVKTFRAAGSQERSPAMRIADSGPATVDLAAAGSPGHGAGVAGALHGDRPPTGAHTAATSAARGRSPPMSNASSGAAPPSPRRTPVWTGSRAPDLTGTGGPSSFLFRGCRLRFERVARG